MKLTNQEKINLFRIPLFVFCCLLVCFLLIFQRSIIRAGESNDTQILINQINDQVNEQKIKIDKLKEQSAIYQKTIDQKQKASLNLKNQLSVIENKIGKIGTEINIKTIEIKRINAEIEQTQLQISQQNAGISQTKQKVAEFIRLIYFSEQRPLWQIILLEPSFSNFYNQLVYSEILQEELQSSINTFQLTKQKLEEYHHLIQDKKEQIEQVNQNLKYEQYDYQKYQTIKKDLLTTTRNDEWKFQSLLAELKKEEQEREAEIRSLERKAKLRLMSADESGEWLQNSGKNIVLSWPVPLRKITCYFHDPDYPFKKWIGEHSGLDLRASQGVQIRAPASGYVVRVKDAGMGYSYILLIHNDSISTLYGHVSKFFVEQDTYVKRGDVIGLTGGIPGTPGAGRFCTGPHLHFEVRLNGLPVNPLNYLL